MTTLQLAEAIAFAVLEEAYTSGGGLCGSTHKWTQAVLKTLRENDCWFCRVQIGPPPVGGIISSEQMELFDVG